MMKYAKNIRCPKCDGKLYKEREILKDLRHGFNIPHSNPPKCVRCGSKYELKIKCEGDLEIGFIEI